MMSDIEISLNTDVRPAFENIPETVATPPTNLVDFGETSPNTIGINDILRGQIQFPTPLNSTFFVKQDGDEEGSSTGSVDTPSALMFEVEQKMRDSVKAIRFKEMLLGRDRHSREVVLRRCIEWLQMPTSRRSPKTLDWFMSLSALKTTDSLENSYLWHTLHENIYASESFKTVISFFDEFT